MANYKVYIEFEGYPLYADIELDEGEYPTEDDVWDYVQDMIQIDIQKVD